MKRFLVAAVLVLCLCSIVYAAYAHETLTVTSSTAVPMTADTYNVPGHTMIYATCTLDASGGDIRYWVDGSTPTASVGHYWAATNTIAIRFTPSEVRNFKGIAISSDAKLICSYEEGS